MFAVRDAATEHHAGNRDRCPGPIQRGWRLSRTAACPGAAAPRSAGSPPRRSRPKARSQAPWHNRSADGRGARARCGAGRSARPGTSSRSFLDPKPSSLTVPPATSIPLADPRWMSKVRKSAPKRPVAKNARGGRQRAEVVDGHTLGLEPSGHGIDFNGLGLRVRVRDKAGARLADQALGHVLGDPGEAAGAGALGPIVAQCRNRQIARHDLAVDGGDLV